VLSESKTNAKIGSMLPFQEYNIFEEPGLRTVGDHLFKWGLVMGVCKDIQISQWLTISQSMLKGCIIALDIILATNNGKGFVHQIIGAYAPWNPGGDETACNFWKDITTLCQDMHTSWTMGGDFNATVCSGKRASGGAEAHAQYHCFLREVNGLDIWSDYPERNRLDDWTSCGHDNPEGGSIIDCVVSSKPTLQGAKSRVTKCHGDLYPSQIIVLCLPKLHMHHLKCHTEITLFF
jgi:hypothetical protein